MSHGKKPRRSWVFKCDCGTYTCYQTDNVTCQGVVTCGASCSLRTRKTHDLLNQKFGRLTVVERIGPSKFGYMQWKCQCDCGNTLITVAKFLEHGQTQSCGACPDQLKSKGNAYISNWLMQHNILFSTEVRFEDCCDKYPLPFDFVVYNKDNKILKCIEYQGNIHYIATGGWITQEHVAGVQRRDKIKAEYCKEHNIDLLVISYTEYKNLDSILKSNFEE